MEIVRSNNGLIYFCVDEEHIKKYGLNLETFRELKPFAANIFDDLLNTATKKYGAKFNKNTSPKSIRVNGNAVIFEVKEKSNIVQLENEFIEKESIINGIWDLLRTLPDEKIDMGIIDIGKKKAILEQFRSDNGTDYIRKYFIN